MLLWTSYEASLKQTDQKSVPVGKEDNNELLRCYLLQVNTSAGECSPEAAICSNEPPSSPERRAARDYFPPSTDEAQPPPPTLSRPGPAGLTEKFHHGYL